MAALLAYGGAVSVDADPDTGTMLCASTFGPSLLDGGHTEDEAVAAWLMHAPPGTMWEAALARTVEGETSWLLALASLLGGVKGDSSPLREAFLPYLVEGLSKDLLAPHDDFQEDLSPRSGNDPSGTLTVDWIAHREWSGRVKPVADTSSFVRHHWGC